MQIHLPTSLAKISKGLPSELVAQAMGSAIRKRINEEKKLIKQAEKKMVSLEKRYKISKKSIKTHQHWVEWSFWTKVYENAKKDLQSFSKIYAASHR